MGENELGQVGEILKLFQWGRVVGVIFGFVVIAILVRVFHELCRYLQMKWPARRHMILQITTMINFGLYIGVGTLMVYAILRPPKELLFAIGGSAAVAIGFSLKDLVASVISGIILLFDRPFQVGDRVSFGDSYGEISSIGLRTVKLVTLDDNLVTIPNSRFLNDVVASGNAGALDMMITAPFHVALSADLDQAKAIIGEVIATSKYAYLAKKYSVVAAEVSTANRLCICLTAKAYVMDCRYEKEFQSDLVERVGREFTNQGIARPQV